MVLANHSKRLPWRGRVIYVKRAQPQHGLLRRRVEAKETIAASRSASIVPTVVPPLTVIAQPSSAATGMVTTQPLAASTVTALGTQSCPLYTPQGSPKLLWVESPCPTQEQQPLPPWLQPLSSLQQLATLALAQALLQDAFQVRIGFSASLFWGAPWALSTQGGRILDPGPLSRRVFTAAVPYAAGVISGVAGSPRDHMPVRQ